MPQQFATKIAVVNAAAAEIRFFVQQSGHPNRKSTTSPSFLLGQYQVIDLAGFPDAERNVTPLVIVVEILPDIGVNKTSSDHVIYTTAKVASSEYVATYVVSGTALDLKINLPS